MKSKQFYIIIFSFISLIARPGEIEDLMKLSKNYSGDNLSLEFRLDMNYSNKKTQSYKGRYFKSKKSFYYSIIHIESFSDDVNSVVVDKDQKLLIIGNSIAAEKTADDEVKKLLSRFRFDSVGVTDTYELKYILNTDQLKKIELKLKDEESEFESIEVTLLADYTLSEIRYAYRKSKAGNHITDYTITYTKQKLNGAVIIPVKLSSFIVQSGKSIKPAKGYEGYKLIDNRFKYK